MTNLLFALPFVAVAMVWMGQLIRASVAEHHRDRQRTVPTRPVAVRTVTRRPLPMPSRPRHALDDTDIDGHECLIRPYVEYWQRRQAMGVLVAEASGRRAR